MNKSKSVQKKNSWNYIYALIVGMLVVACSVTIALISANNTTKASIGNETIPVSNSMFVVPDRKSVV